MILYFMFAKKHNVQTYQAFTIWLYIQDLISLLNPPYPTEVKQSSMLYLQHGSQVILDSGYISSGNYCSQSLLLILISQLYPKWQAASTSSQSQNRNTEITQITKSYE